MKRLVVATVLTGLALTASIGAFGAPYEDYKIQIQRQHDEKRRALVSEAAYAEDRAAMKQHMQLMQEMDAQVQQAQNLDKMTAEQLREWIAKHNELMPRMHQQKMMDGRQPMGRSGGLMQDQSKLRVIAGIPEGLRRFGPVPSPGIDVAQRAERSAGVQSNHALEVHRGCLPAGHACIAGASGGGHGAAGKRLLSRQDGRGACCEELLRQA